MLQHSSQVNTNTSWRATLKQYLWSQHAAGSLHGSLLVRFTSTLLMSVLHRQSLNAPPSRMLRLQGSPPSNLQTIQQRSTAHHCARQCACVKGFKEQVRAPALDTEESLAAINRAGTHRLCSQALSLNERRVKPRSSPYEGALALVINFSPCLITAGSARPSHRGVALNNSDRVGSAQVNKNCRTLAGRTHSFLM